MRTPLYYSLLAAAIVPAWTAKIAQCPLAGPEYLPPRSLLNSAVVKKATEDINQALEVAVRNGTSDFGRVDGSQTSFSIGVYSLYEEEPLLIFNHDGPKLPKPEIGVSKVDANTIYRLGSISKLLSVYLYLATIGDKSFNDPVTDYIPEFAEYAARHQNPQDHLDIWNFESMTVGALAGQLSGLPRGTIGNFGLNKDLQGLGLPKLTNLPPPNVTGANCPNSYHTPCTRAEFLQNIIDQKPTNPAYYRAAYSNVAYGVMGLVLEKITGQAMPDLFKKNLVEPLKMNATSYAAPPTPDNGIIPFNNSVSHWTTNIGNQSAAGNYYSSINDMARLGKAMMNSTLLTPAMTRHFMSPGSFVARLRSAVGTPWELYDASPEIGKSNWLATKQGDIGTYSTTMALMPHWKVGFTVLTAGLASGVINQALPNIIATKLAPALEQAAKEQARADNAGTYRDTKKNSTVVLDVDDGPGILVKEWTVEGTDMYKVWVELQGGTGTVLRLYPSGLASGANNEIIGYRLVAYTNNPQVKAYKGEIITLACYAWIEIDSVAFGRHGLDEFAIKTDPRTGKAVAVEPRAFGDMLPRV